MDIDWCWGSYPSWDNNTGHLYCGYMLCTLSSETNYILSQQRVSIVELYKWVGLYISASTVFCTNGFMQIGEARDLHVEM